MTEIAAPPSLVLSHCPPSTWRIHARADQPRCSQDLAQANWCTTEDLGNDADLVRLVGPAVVGIRRWNKEWASLAMDLAQDRRPWSAAVRDAVNAMDTDSARAG